MFIVQKSAEQINRFILSLSTLNDRDEAQKIARKYYSDACLTLEKHVFRTSPEYQCPFGKQTLEDVYIVLSSNTRSFVINNEFEITLQLYQVRSKDKKHHEDILVEPFYPRTKVLLPDLYNIIKAPKKRSSGIQGPLTYRIRYDIHRKFIQRWSVSVGSNCIPLNSFEEFHTALHQLKTEQLRSLFGTSISFIKLLHRQKNW